jgi:AcrR family transcriptional regulator
VGRRSTSAIDPAALVAALAAGSPEPDSGDPVDDALLDATGDLIAAFGVKRWSMEDVATRSGLGRSTVYRRFEGRGHLLHAALARDVRRFFAAVADAVEEVDGLESKVVEGFLVGLRALRRSLLARLIEIDQGTVIPALTAPPLPDVARQALVERYLLMVPDGDAARAAVVAEALVRLAVSFLLMPASAIDVTDDVDARRALQLMVGSLVR